MGNPVYSEQGIFTAHFRGGDLGDKMCHKLMQSSVQFDEAFYLPLPILMLVCDGGCLL